MKKPVVIGLAVVVLAAVVAGGYWWYQSRQDNGLTLYGNVDIRTVNLMTRPSRGAKCCFIPMVARTSRITGRLVSFRRLLNLPRKPSKHRICVPTSSIACVLW